jgi:hypothetical protein
MTATNLPVLPEVLLGTQSADQQPLDLATQGTQRYVWLGAFGAMLIEVRDGAAYVNGQRVTSMAELRGPAV